jgi:hypothetical protein
MTLNQKVTTAKALRKSFNQTQSELITSSYMGDEYLLKQLKTAQDEYNLFNQLVDEIKEENKEEYEKQILGV